MLQSSREYEEFILYYHRGVDSRSVLAQMLYNGLRPTLDITGTKDHIDVQIAKKISEKTQLDIIYVDDSTEDGWIDKAIEAAKLGCCGVCGLYRLSKKAWLFDNYDNAIEFGGVGGESYKNKFLNQDYPFYFGKANWIKFLKYKVLIYRFPDSICGDSIKKYVNNIEDAA